MGNKMDIITFNRHYYLYYKNLNLGDDLEVRTGRTIYSNCRFIKVTRKGFNILDLDTDRTILKKHVYAKGMGNKEYPNHGSIAGSFLIPEHVQITVKPKTNQKVS